MSSLLSARYLYNEWIMKDNASKKWLMCTFLMKLEWSSIFHLGIKQCLHKGGHEM